MSRELLCRKTARCLQSADFLSLHIADKFSTWPDLALQDFIEFLTISCLAKTNKEALEWMGPGPFLRRPPLPKLVYGVCATRTCFPFALPPLLAGGKKTIVLNVGPLVTDLKFHRLPGSNNIGCSLDQDLDNFKGTSSCSVESTPKTNPHFVFLFCDTTVLCQS